MPKTPPRSANDPLEALEIPMGPEWLDRDLEGCRQRFEADTTNALPAFLALSSLAAYLWHQPDRTSSKVPVPFWAVEVIAAGFGIYTTARKKGRNTTLGEAFGLEGGGQGKEPRILKETRENRDRNIALSVVLQRDQHKNLEKTIAAVAADHGLSDKRVWGIWSKFGKSASKRLERHKHSRILGK